MVLHVSRRACRYLYSFVVVTAHCMLSLLQNERLDVSERIHTSDIFMSVSFDSVPWRRVFAHSAPHRSVCPQFHQQYRITGGVSRCYMRRTFISNSGSAHRHSHFSALSGSVLRSQWPMSLAVQKSNCGQAAPHALDAIVFDICSGVWK